MFKNWFKILVFNLRKNKLYTIISVLGLSFGISTVLLASLYWKQEHSYDQWNPNKDHIYEVLMDFGNNKIWYANVGPLANQMKASSSAIEESMYYSGWPYSYSFNIDGKNKTADVTSVQGNFFNFFPFEISKGNKQNFAEKTKAIALSEEEAIRLFGEEDPIGKVITNEENKAFTITTIYKLNKQSSFTPKAIINDIQLAEDDWNNFSFALLIKIKNPQDLNSIQSTTANILKKNFLENNAKQEGITVAEYIQKYGNISPVFTKLTDARLVTKDSGLPNHGGNYKLLIVNIGISILILILSIVNQINLSTAYILKRVKEFGVRRIIGATKRNIIYQLIFETSIYILVSIVLAFALVEIILPYYNDLLKHELHFNIIDSATYILLIFIIIILCCAILPALYVSNINIQNALKNKASYNKNRELSKQTLLVLQFVISFLFLSLGIIIYKQVNYMMNQDLGFKGDQVISITYYNYEKKDRYAYYKKIAEQLRKIPGVNAVSGSNIRIGSGSPQRAPLHYKEKNVESTIIHADYDLLPLLGAIIVEGRNFDKNFASDSLNNIILNETAIKALGITNPVNQTIQWDDKPHTIVGVVKDFNITGFAKAIPPNLYTNGGTAQYVRNNMRNIYIKLDNQDIEKTIANIERYWNEKVDPYYPFEYDFVDKQFQRVYFDYIKQRNLFTILNITVLSIAMFGLFSLASFSIERRLKEIAIKKVLGADTKKLIIDLSKRYIIICIISFLIAIVPSYLIIQEWLANFTYRIDIEYSMFLLIFLFMFSLTLILVISKGYIATRINPLNYLKYE